MSNLRAPVAPVDRILLIKSRWQSSETVSAQVEAVRAGHPTAKIALLGDACPAADDIIFIPMPDLHRGSPLRVVPTILALRRTVYGAAIVIADEARQEAGYGEAKFWVFMARSRSRRLGMIRPLRPWQEFTDKWRRVGFQRLAARVIRAYAAIVRPIFRPRPSSPASALAVRRLESFVILRQIARAMPGSPAGLLALGDRDAAFLAVAREQGWSPCFAPADGSAAPAPDAPPTTGAPNAAPSAPPPARFPVVVAMGSLDGPDAAAALFARAAPLLAPNGRFLVRIRTGAASGPDRGGSTNTDLSREELAPAAAAAGLCLVSAKPSLCLEQAMDLWLAPAGPEEDRR